MNTAHPQDQGKEPPTPRATVLTCGGSRARILHAGQTCILRITRTGKLFLTK